MKAKAMFLTMLICLMGIAGFGQTTSDLNKNSTTEISLQGDSASVAIQTPVLQDVFEVTTNIGTMEVRRYANSECEFLVFSQVQNPVFVIQEPKTENPILNDSGGELSNFYIVASNYTGQSENENRSNRSIYFDPNCYDISNIKNRKARDALTYEKEVL